MIGDYYTPEEDRRDKINGIVTFIAVLALPALFVALLFLCTSPNADVEDRYVVVETEHVPTGKVAQWSTSDEKMSPVLADRPETWYLRVRSVDTSASYVVKFDDPSAKAILVGDEILLRRGFVRP